MPAAENRQTGSSRGRAAGVARALRLDRSVGPESPGTLMRSKTDRELTTAATSHACSGLEERCRRSTARCCDGIDESHFQMRNLVSPSRRPNVQTPVSDPVGPERAYATAGQCRSQPVTPRKRLTSAVWGPLRDKMADTEGMTVNIFGRGLLKRDGASLLEYQSHAVCRRSLRQEGARHPRSALIIPSCRAPGRLSRRLDSPQRSPCAWQDSKRETSLAC